MKPSGSIFYQDVFETLYHLDWETVNDVIDLTSIVFQPYVWGDMPNGYIKDNVLFRRGIVTITRQILRPFPGGYEIIADGTSQYIDYGQMNFPCQPGPKDTFKFHLNNGLVDECEGIVTDGPRWADPDDLNDLDAIWGDLDASGDPITTLTMTGGADIFAFVDVWS